MQLTECAIILPDIVVLCPKQDLCVSFIFVFAGSFCVATTVIIGVLFFIVGLVGGLAGGVLYSCSGRVNTTLHPVNLLHSMRT